MIFWTGRAGRGPKSGSPRCCARGRAGALAEIHHLDLVMARHVLGADAFEIADGRRAISASGRRRRGSVSAVDRFTHRRGPRSGRPRGEPSPSRRDPTRPGQIEALVFGEPLDSISSARRSASSASIWAWVRRRRSAIFSWRRSISPRRSKIRPLDTGFLEAARRAGEGAVLPRDRALSGGCRMHSSQTHGLDWKWEMPRAFNR